MRKPFVTTLMVASFVLAFSALAMARVSPNNDRPGNDRPGNDRPGPSAPSDPAATASPADRDASAQRTNYVWVLDGVVRKTQNPGFCQRNPNDAFVKAGKAECENY